MEVTKPNWLDTIREFLGKRSTALVLIALVIIQEFAGLSIIREFYAISSPVVQVIGLGLLLCLLIVGVTVAARKHGQKQDMQDQVQELKTRLETAEQDVAQHEKRYNHLLEIDSREGIWKRECVIKPPDFVPATQRKTRFLTVVNLKGGVGKTTLCANLAAYLSHDIPTKRVLLIDVDFQGTLSEATVDRSLVHIQEQHNSFVSRLLFAAPEAKSLVPELVVPMRMASPAQVIMARDELDINDYLLQARFFIDPNQEPRYQFVSHLHRQEIYDAYDLVIFDCPPRVTTSVVNAMVCSDWILIPTRLDRGSVDAVPKTLRWMKSLGVHCRADLLGVVAMQVMVRSNRLTREGQERYNYLRSVIKAEGWDDRLFDSVVPATPRALPDASGLTACITDEGREVFKSVVEEMTKRMKI